MPTLHTVNKSPFERSAFISALNHMRPGDARKASAFAALLENASQRCAIYVLAPDLAARGMAEKDLVPAAKLVDYGGFVDLVVQHARTQAWL